MSIFGRIEGAVYGDYVRLEPSHNIALVELLLAGQAKKTLDAIEKRHNKSGICLPLQRDIVIFRGRDFQGDYMGWRTGRRDFMDKSMDVVAEHQI